MILYSLYSYDFRVPSGLTPLYSSAASEVYKRQSSARLQAQADAFFASMAASSGSIQYPSQVAATTNVQTVAPTTVNVNVEGSVLSEQDLTRTIQNMVLVSTKYGNKYIPAGYIE